MKVFVKTPMAINGVAALPGQEIDIDEPTARALWFSGDLDVKEVPKAWVEWRKKREKGEAKPDDEANAKTAADTKAAEDETPDVG